MLETPHPTDGTVLIPAGRTALNQDTEPRHTELKASEVYLLGSPKRPPRDYPHSGVVYDDERKKMEAAYWQNQTMNGRRVTSMDVLHGYRKDFTSQRAGFFMRRLYQQKIRLKERPVTPEQVITEYLRSPDRHERCQLAVARFQASCCLAGITLNGRPVTVEAVAASFPTTPEGKLGLVRFREECCLKNIPLRGKPVTAESVAMEFQAMNAVLELAHFKARCCANKIQLHGQYISPRSVVDSFPDTEAGRRGVARFKEKCTRLGVRLDNQTIPVEVVLNELKTAGTALDLVHFKSHCCLEEKLINGAKISPQSVIDEFLTIIEQYRQENSANGNKKRHGQPDQAKTTDSDQQKHYYTRPMDFPDIKDPEISRVVMGLTFFRARCCLQGLVIEGESVTPDTVAADFLALGAQLELSRFKADCCVAGLKLDGKPISQESVVQELLDIDAKLGVARFKEKCFEQGLPLGGQQITRETVARGYRKINATLELARFKEECCIKHMSLFDRPVLPEDVIKDFEKVNAILEVARFKEICCLKSIPVNGSPVLPGAVLDTYRAIRATRELMRFKATCCLENLTVNGQQISADAIVEGFRGQKAEAWYLANFMSSCCLNGRLMNGQPVRPEQVLDFFPNNRFGQMALARFKEECCLRSLPINGALVPTATVLACFPENMDGKVARGRFMQTCCLRGLLVQGTDVAPEAVVAAFPANAEGRMGVAHLLNACFLRGRLIDGQPVTGQEVIASYPQNPKGRSCIAAFMERCCLKGLPINGQPVTPDAVLTAMQKCPSQLPLACFKANCCLHDLPLVGQPVTADEAMAAFPDNEEAHKLNFKKQCCLNEIPLHGQPVDPQQLIREFEQSKQLLEKAVFYSELALRARPLNGHYLSYDDVLEAFDQLLEDHTARKVDFLLQQLMALPHDSDMAPTTLRQACQILDRARIKDERHSFQRCVLQFLTAQIPTLSEPVTLEQAWQSIQALKTSHSNIRLQFFFLAHCYSHGATLNGDPVQYQEIIHCLKALPPGKLRTALSHWLNSLPMRVGTADILGHLVHDKDNPDAPGPVDIVQRVSEQPDSQSAASLWAKQVSTTTRKALAIIQNIPHLNITGSFSRCLQGISSSFNDIDLLATHEAAATLITHLIYQLDNQEGQDAEVPCNVVAQVLPGCPEVHMPTTFNITQSEGDLGQNVMVLQASVHPPAVLADLDHVDIPIPGDDNPLRCLPFCSEVRLLNEALQHLADRLDPLTAQLQSGADFNIPRTVLFNYPKHPQERIFGLLMRCLLTLNKAKQFMGLMTDSQAGDRLSSLRTHSHDMHVRLQRHSHYKPFITALNQWLLTCNPRNNYFVKKCDFIRDLLAVAQNPPEPP